MHAFSKSFGWMFALVLVAGLVAAPSVWAQDDAATTDDAAATTDDAVATDTTEAAAPPAAGPLL